MKKIVAVEVIKDLPGAPAGTVLKKPLCPPGSGFANLWMTPDCMGDEGHYIASYSYLHYEEHMIERYPDFFKVEYCCCCECKCHQEGG